MIGSAVRTIAKGSHRPSDTVNSLNALDTSVCLSLPHHCHIRGSKVIWPVEISTAYPPKRRIKSSREKLQLKQSWWCLVTDTMH